MDMQEQMVWRWQDGAWHQSMDTVSREVLVHVACAGERFRLWASPHDERALGYLALGHVLLEGGNGRGMRKMRAESVLQSGLSGKGRRTMVRSVPSAEGEYSFAVCLDLKGGVYSAAEDRDAFSASPAFEVPRQEPGADSTGDEAAAPAVYGAAGLDVHNVYASSAQPGHWDGITPVKLLANMKETMSTSGLWDATGCFHRCAVWSPVSEQVLYTAEDIGRHNCLDRIAGWAWQEGVDLAEQVLFFSARITASMYVKARRAGVRCLVTCGAVSSSAVQGAQDDGVTLVGFCRSQEDRLTVYVNGLGVPGLEPAR